MCVYVRTSRFWILCNPSSNNLVLKWIAIASSVRAEDLFKNMVMTLKHQAVTLITNQLAVRESCYCTSNLSYVWN